MLVIHQQSARSSHIVDASRGRVNALSYRPDKLAKIIIHLFYVALMHFHLIFAVNKSILSRVAGSFGQLFYRSASGY